MRILYLGDAQSIHTQRWVNYFARHGHEILLVSNRPALLDGIAVYDIGGMSYIHKILVVRKIIKEFKPDILHAHYVTSYGFLGAMSGFSPFVLTGWGSDILVTPRKNWIYRQLIRFVLNKADLITVDAHDMVTAIRNLAPSCNDKIQVIQWGVDLEHFNMENKSNFKAELGLQNDFVILSTRNLEPNYNIDIIIKAFASFASEVPDAKLLILGGGSQKGNLITLIKNLNIENRIQFIGYTSYKDIAKYYKSADIFISVPTSDATSMSLLEAMACGAVPIVSELPANHEWIIPEHNGYIINSSKAEEITSVLKTIYYNKTILAKYGKINYNIIFEKANHYQEMAKMGILYQNLISN